MNFDNLFVSQEHTKECDLLMNKNQIALPELEYDSKTPDVTLIKGWDIMFSKTQLFDNIC